MPELPDIVVYVEALQERTVGRALERLRIGSPFILRTARPPVEALDGRSVTGVRRIGKRIALDFADGLFAVIHLMVAGRLHWRPPGARLGGKAGLAAFDFEHGTLLLTEAATRKRAALHLVEGAEALRDLNPGGMETLEVDARAFCARLRAENHTLKRALTDPRLFSGIGNAYSDEILHRARLSPLALTLRLSDEDATRLHAAVREVLGEWTARLREQAGGGFPDKVTAFHPGMAVHGRAGQPCPACGSPVQRIVYAENEANYCAGCQTSGRLLADRALSRLLKQDWPRTLAELEEHRRARGAGPAG
ncbi:MAG: formamidopyrimidine-DNA glycosylase [Chthonomonadales bacterium]|nr:formamidopyrimidine-DNA glycosylase [Chthonomonadales bacterium]